MIDIVTVLLANRYSCGISSLERSYDDVEMLKKIKCLIVRHLLR